MLLWKRYGINKMAAMRYYVLHLQQYSHRLNLLYIFFQRWKEMTIAQRLILLISLQSGLGSSDTL